MSAEGDLTSVTAIDAANRIAGGELSAEEYTGAFLDRIAAIDDKVRAFAHLDRKDALAQARALDERRRNGYAIGPLHGIPVGIKDIFDTADYKTECGSPLLKGRQPNLPISMLDQRAIRTTLNARQAAHRRARQRRSQLGWCR